MENPASRGQLRILNQFTETLSVVEIAEIVISAAKSLSIVSTVEHIKNPRKELEDQYYNPKHLV